ncbi:MAG TPA: 1,2-phenylacetyl-CoA epoxidase subunit PaaC, partial [Chloroflexia bacterium]|nr:1,2-phenylacetyl-CoA epoxidase subunit PaaC [Chloroflexia bacterium]
NDSARSDALAEVPRFSTVTTATDDALAEAARLGVEGVLPSPAFDVLPSMALPAPGAPPPMPEWLMALDAAAAPDLDQALNGLLLALADDEFILGYRNSEWTGIAPMLEEDVAFSSMSQDEIGHARLYYTLLGTRVGVDPDQIAYGRPAEGVRNATFLEIPRTNWAFTLVRQFLYDQYDQLRLEGLAHSQWAPLAEVIGKIQREEKYHAMHGTAWMQRLAENTPEARMRLEAVLPAAWAAAASLFAPLPGESLLVQAGYMAATTADLHAVWRDRVGAFLHDLRVALPPLPAPEGRRGEHSPDFTALWDELTIVYRIDPTARW